MIRRNQQRGVYVPRRSSSLAAVLSGQNSTGEQISKMAMDSNNFGSGYAGAWGVVAQGLTAGIGAWTQKKERDQEAMARRAFAEQFPEHASLASQLSPESREAISAKILMGQLENNAPAPQSSLGKLAADYHSGLIDQKAYNAAIRKETMFAPDANASGGATGAIIANLRKENPKLSYADALAYALGLARKGYRYDNQGNVAPMPGLLEAQEANQAAQEKGKETGKKLGVQKTKEIQAPVNLDLIARAEKLLPQSSSGTLSNVATKAANFAGYSTKKGQVDEQLKGIAANLTLNVPRMEGPQSDKDTDLYKEAAANVGNPSIPWESRQAGLQAIKNLNQKYDSQGNLIPAQQTQQPQSFNGFKVIKVRSK